MTAGSKLQKPLLLALALALLAGASLAQRGVNRERETLGLTRLKPLENAPPLLAFTTVALGGFRGLIANALWIRAVDLQDEGKYFEMVQLADWITKLQPHIPAVWYHLAWNMAYNISVKFENPNDRWVWVQRGIQLLRDQALVYNPKETILYRELSWIYQHKIGANLDDAHFTYKRGLLNQVTDLLGSDLLGSGRVNWQELAHPTTDEGRKRLERLKTDAKLDPEFMRQVDEKYGPLEWRLPEAHAIYWAAQGMRYGNRTDQEKIKRSIYQTMQQAFFHGWLIENRVEKGSFSVGPNLDIIPKVNATYVELMTPTDYAYNPPAHRNFIKAAIEHLYTFNRRREAGEWLAYLREKYPDAIPVETTLDDYVVDQVADKIQGTSMDQITAVLRGYLLNAYEQLALGDDDRASAFELIARNVWQRYDKKVKGQAKRLGLPPMDELRQQTLDVMLDPERGLQPLLAAQLRTKLGLPPPTNAPPGAPTTPATPAAPAGSGASLSAPAPAPGTGPGVPRPNR